MKTTSLQLDIVSAEKAIFSGMAQMIFITGELGELGIAPGHAPLISTLKPGNVHVRVSATEEDIFYISGGMLEVQPTLVTVLADTAIRADDIDNAAAIAAKEAAERRLTEKLSQIDYARAMVELSQALAQIHALQKIRKLKR